MPFAYWKDPLFLVCFGAYWGHRCLKSFGFSSPLLCAYLNDIVCVPFWLPMMLWAHKKLGLRRHDDPPESFEIVVPLLIWSALFEVVIPGQTEWPIPAVADPRDIICYSAGALFAALFWRWRYCPRPPSV